MTGSTSLQGERLDDSPEESTRRVRLLDTGFVQIQQANGYAVQAVTLVTGQQ